ncbi:MAG: sigma-70 family RNA polymerase sigma factor [Candidatus Acidiferrales bacterium]
MSAEAPERLLWLPLVARERADAKSTESVPRATAVLSDEELLGMARSGNSDAIGVLFDRYSRLILGIGFRILRDTGEAEDLLQEVFLRLCSKGNTFDATKGPARGWMVQVAYRRALDRRSYLTKRSFYNGTEVGEIENALEDAIGLEELVASRLSGEQLHAAFATLSEKQRATLELFFFESCSLQEIAQRLGDTLQNVRHHYYRGLEHLRKTAAALALLGEK